MPNPILTGATGKPFCPLLLPFPTSALTVSMREPPSPFVLIVERKRNNNRRPYTPWRLPMRWALTTTPRLARFVAPFYRRGHLPRLTAFTMLRTTSDHFVYLGPCLTTFTMCSMRKRLLSAVFPAVPVQGLELYADHHRG